MGHIKNYTPPKPSNQYADDIAELVKEGGAWSVEAKGVQDPDSGAWNYSKTELGKYQAAAREAGYTAKVVEQKVDKSSHTATYIFVLADRIVRRPSEKAESGTAETGDTDAA